MAEISSDKKNHFKGLGDTTNEYIKNYQKNRYNTDEEYKQKIKEKNKLSYDKKKDDEGFKAKQRMRNNKAYQAIKEMKEKIKNMG